MERLTPDLIIIDVFLGTTPDGWELMRRLKAHPATASIPLMLCTAGRLTSEQERLTQSEGIPIVYKPFELDQLEHLVHSLSTQRSPSAQA